MINLRVLTSIVLLVLIALAGNAQSVAARTKIGVGGELIGRVPLLIGTTRISNFGGMLGIGVSGSASILTADGRFYLSLGNFPLDPYLGGGVAIITGGLISLTGFNVIGGIEFSFSQLGLPLTAFGGLNYMSFGRIGAFSLGGVTTHLGVKLEF